MNLREQIDAAWYEHEKTSPLTTGQYDWQYFKAGFRAALALIANPDDEMVERLDKEFQRDGYYIPKVILRACLKAVVGEA